MSLFDEVSDLKIGDDVTNILNIKKYEAPIPAELTGTVLGAMPSFIKKTDEERIQNIPEIIQAYNGKIFNASVKLDGTSVTMYFNKGTFGVCGRNWEYLESTSNSMWKIANQLDLKNKLIHLNENIAIQGELVGEGIQGNPEKLKGQHYFIFKIWLIDQQRYASFEEKQALLKLLGLSSNQVPQLPPFALPDSMDKVLALADGPSLNTPNREGIVVEGHGISFKIISNWYLLHHDS